MNPKRRWRKGNVEDKIYKRYGLQFLRLLCSKNSYIYTDLNACSCLLIITEIFCKHRLEKKKKYDIYHEHEVTSWPEAFHGKGLSV